MSVEWILNIQISRVSKTVFLARAIYLWRASVKLYASLNIFRRKLPNAPRAPRTIPVKNFFYFCFFTSLYLFSLFVASAVFSTRQGVQNGGFSVHYLVLLRSFPVLRSQDTVDAFDVLRKNRGDDKQRWDQQKAKFVLISHHTWMNGYTLLWLPRSVWEKLIGETAFIKRYCV